MTTISQECFYQQALTQYSFLKKKKDLFYYLICMSVLLACTSIQHMHVWCLLKPEEGIRSDGTGVNRVESLTDLQSNVYLLLHGN